MTCLCGMEFCFRCGGMSCSPAFDFDLPLTSTSRSFMVHDLEEVR